MTSMTLKKLYAALEETLETIDFAKLWPGFHRYPFALYNSAMVILEGKDIQKTDEFLANTAILYRGHYLAIWQLDDGSLDEYYDASAFLILTSKIIHEMFHAFQYESKEKRFANELEALTRYRYSPDYMQVKHEEDLLLCRLTECFSQRMLNEFLVHRMFRQIEYPYEYRYEASIEAIEGSASFVELQVLKQCNDTLYTMRLREILAQVSTFSNLIPIRIISYDIGALFLTVCKEQQLDINWLIGPMDDIFYSGLIDLVSYQKKEYPVSPDIKAFFDEDQRMLRSKFDDILQHPAAVWQGDFELLGLNVYSARYLDGYVFSEHFIAYRDGATPISQWGNFLCALQGPKVVKVYKEA